MADLLSWSSGLSFQKKKDENNPFLSSFRTNTPSFSRSNSLSTLSNQPQLSTQFNQRLQQSRQNEAQRQQKWAADQQQQESQRKIFQFQQDQADQARQEEAQRQQRFAEAQRQAEAQRKLQEQQAQQRAAAEQAAAQKLQQQKAAQQQTQNQQNNTTGDEWKKYYEEEKQKVRDQAFKNDHFGSTLQDIFNAGWDRRLAETNARNRYNSELLAKAYDDEGNIKDQAAADLAKQSTNEASNVAAQYSAQEHARGKALGATADSDYKDDPFYATLNAVRNMDVGNAMLGGAEGGLADATKFVLNLLPGMASAPITGGGNIAEAIRGQGTDSSTGEHRDLTTLERLGRGASGAIDAAGVFFGGSGDLLSSVGKALFKKTATETTKQALKQTTKEVVKGYIKAMLEEGAEEGVQQAFEFFGDGGRLVTSDGEFDADSFKQLLAESGQAAALGAVGGGLFHAGGQVIDTARNKMASRKGNTNAETNIGSNFNNNLVGTNTNFNENTNTETDVSPSKIFNAEDESRINTNEDGSMVKTNEDGTTERLSDAELANVISQSSSESTSSSNTVNGLNPFKDNGFNFKSSSEDINTLARRAEQGDTYAKRRLAELAQNSDQNQNTDWRGKSVDEVINPEDENNLSNREETKIGENLNEDTLQKAVDDLNGKTFDELTPEEQVTWLSLHGDQVMSMVQLAQALRKMDIDPTGMSRLDMLREYSRALKNTIPGLNAETEVGSAPEILPSERAINQDQETVQYIPRDLAQEPATPTRADTAGTGEGTSEASMRIPTTEELSTATPEQLRKSSQFAMLQETNPMTDGYHTGIRSAEEINSLNDLVNGYDADTMFTYPDFTVEDAQKAVKDGEVTVYSSKPIEPGTFVSPSKMMAQDYAGSGEVYSKTIPINDFAAIISGDEGNYLPVSNNSAPQTAGSNTNWNRQTSKNSTEVSSINEALADDGSNKRRFTTVLKGVSDRVANIVKKAIGLDISGYDHTVDNYAMKHAIEGHKNDKIPLKASDFGLIQDIISNPDSVEYSSKDKGAIVYKKQYNDRVVYLEEVRNKRHELAMKTMYWQEAQKNSTTGSANPHLGSDTDSLRALSRQREGANTSIVSPNGQNVNAKSSFAENTSGNRNFSNETRTELKTDPLTYKPVTNEERLARANEILSTKSSEEIDNYLRENFFNVKPKDANSADMVLAGEYAKMLDTKGMFDRSTEIINKMSEIGTKQGQNIQALSLMMNRSPEGIANMAQTAIKKGGGEMNGELRQQIVSKTQEIGQTRGKRSALAEENAKISQQIMNGEGDLKALRKRQMQIAQEYRLNLDQEGRQFSQLSDIVSKNSPDKRSVFGSIWRAGLLSGPRTHTGNAVSNTFQNVLNAGADRIAAGLDWARSKITGTERQVVTSAGGRTQGLKRGLSAAGEVLKTGNNLWEGVDTVLGKSDAWGQGGELEFKNKVANNMVAKPTNYVFRAMSAGDLPFRYAAFENAIRTEAKRQGINQGLRGQALNDYVNSRVATPDPELQAYGIRKGNESVYDVDTKLSDIMKRVDKFIDSQDNKIVKNGLKAAKTMIAPFVKVPSKVLSTAIDYSPLGSVKALVNKIGTKGYTVGQFETDLAKSGLGSTAFVGLGYALSAAGLLTGGYPEDKDERNRWKAEGIEPNSIKIGDKYISLNYLGPASMLMSMGSGVQQRQAKGEDALEIASGTMMDTLNTFLDQSYVQGLSNAVNAVTDSQRYGDSYVNSFARGLVPNLLRQTAVATDPMQRQSNNAGEAIISGIPGLSQTLDAKVDAYGREIENKQTLPLGQMWDALKISNSRETNDVIDEVNRLHGVDPNNKDLQVTPPMEDNTLSVNGTNVKITDAQKTQLQKDVGEAAIMAMRQVMQSSEYANLSDTEKAKALDKARSNAQTQARKQFIEANNLTPENNPGTRNSGGNVSGDYASKAITSAISNTEGKSAVTANNSLSQQYKDILNKYNSMSKEEWNEFINGSTAESAAAEYNLAKAKYENSLANNELTDAQKVKKEKELRKLNVSKSWEKKYRDAYSLAGSKSDMQEYLNGLDDVERAETVGILNGLNRAMYDAGVIQASTYKTRSNAINNTTTAKSSSSSSKSGGMSSAEASALASLAKTLAKADDNVKVNTPKAPETKRKINKKRSSGNKSGLATYTPSGSTRVTVTKGAKRSIV